jgi:NDP-sugar pyrophosphorylase family protein
LPLTSVDALAPILRQLWADDPDSRLNAILPRDGESLAGFYPRLRQYVDGVERHRSGTIDPAAIVAGVIVSMGPGSVIEAGAIIHESCRLILGAGSRIRSGAVLRDEVVIGDDCMVGVHCEVVRSVILGPGTALGHLVFVADSIIGRDVVLAGYVAIANSKIHKAAEIAVRTGGEKVMTGRTYLGALVGDRARIGASTTVCPGTIVHAGLELPPASVLLGVIDARRREQLMRDFFVRWGGEGH